jgi:hypothetical protein
MLQMFLGLDPVPGAERRIHAGAELSKLDRHPAIATFNRRFSGKHLSAHGFERCQRMGRRDHNTKTLLVELPTVQPRRQVARVYQEGRVHFALQQLLSRARLSVRENFHLESR